VHLAAAGVEIGLEHRLFCLVLVTAGLGELRLQLVGGRIIRLGVVVPAPAPERPDPESTEQECKDSSDEPMLQWRFFSPRPSRRITPKRR
jgi:hypothetical protein